MQVCKINRNYAIRFHKPSGKKILLYVCQKMFLKISRELINIQLFVVVYLRTILTKQMYHWEKTRATVITFLMAND